MICIHCGATVDDNAVYCSQCGSPIVRSHNFCTNPNCEAYVKKIAFPIGEHFCKFCGASTTDSEDVNKLT